MAEPEVKQRLAAILAADVAGYTRLRNMSPEHIEQLMDGLRKAGLDVPEEG
ncbi:MAG: hypothetical protein QF926_11855 [Alphaproteobacteria bacterium]|jgi:class 3 adenylate cyclase|nr:hypothetical protein [Alphaproteobacteria bacterium]MDP6517300.1 hypothetical protein [Alphaproteobacteria bacterium]